MDRRIGLQCIALALCALLIFQPALLWAKDSWDEINDLAERDMEQLEKGIINVSEFCGEPWYIRHWGKLLLGTVIVIGTVAIVCTGGAAAPAAGLGAAHFAGTGAAIGASGAAIGAAATAGAGIYIDNKGNIKIPEDKRMAVKRFYHNNYKSWVKRSSTKKEFGELAIKEITQFLIDHK